MNSNGARLVVGCKIEGQKIEGNIVVQTPAYLNPNVFNILD